MEIQRRGPRMGADMYRNEYLNSKSGRAEFGDEE